MPPRTINATTATHPAGLAPQPASESGYILLGVLILVACFCISLAVAVPQMARSIQRDREEEAVQRGRQYTRAIRLFYRKFGKYPSTLDELMNSSNGRYLRKRYIDPITGKDDWKLIHLGEAKVPSLGFFGIPDAIGSPVNASGQSAPGQPASTQPAGPQQSVPGMNAGNPSEVSAASTNSSSVFGAGFGTASPAPSPDASQPTAFSASSNNPLGGEGGITIGQIVGVGIPLDKASLLTFRRQGNYSRWEFVYDPIQERRQAIPNPGSLNGAGKDFTDPNSVPLSSTVPDGSDPKLTPQPDPNGPLN